MQKIPKESHMVTDSKVIRLTMLTVIVIALSMGLSMTVSPLYPADTTTIPPATIPTSSKIEKKPKLDVGYMPTPYEIVEKMLNMANVRNDDLVYDLGCGDGRVVIMAAKERGAKGVGVDLDPVRIKESEENARKAGVADRVRFYEQDLFKTEIKKATVVMLYLWPQVNIRVRSKLFAELKPGTRVLSHNHDMGEWKPDQYAEISKHRIYFWVIPANIAGSWIWPMKMGSRTTDAILQLNQKFQKITGTLTIDNSTIPVTSANLSGNQLNLSAEVLIDRKKVTIQIAAQAEGNALRGTMEMTDTSAKSKTTWNAERNKGK
jgi:SAM-dependent methyltransferase